MNYCLMKETTDWRNEPVANGIYVFESKPKNTRINKALGFISKHTDEIKWFKTPMGIDFKGRTFMEVCK